MMFMGVAPLGALIEGTLAGYIGAAQTVAPGGCVCILGAAVFGYRLTGPEEEGRQMIVSMQMTGAETASKAFSEPPHSSG